MFSDSFGLNPARLASDAYKERRVAALRRESGNRPILLNVGRLVGYKGQRHAIEAMKELDALLWIVGTGGPTRSF
jgi:glycosyltransferase involved in cell wall biosynthesis